MGTGCSTVIEWRGPDGWHVFPENLEHAARCDCAFSDVYIPRDAELYKILGWLQEVYQRTDEAVAMPHTDGPPSDMSAELEKHIDRWEDWNVHERMSFMTLDQLRSVSSKWDQALVGEGCDPADVDEDVHVTLRGRVAAAERASVEHGGAEVRMVYWFTS